MPLAAHAASMSMSAAQITAPPTTGTALVVDSPSVISATPMTQQSEDSGVPVAYHATGVRDNFTCTVQGGHQGSLPGPGVRAIQPAVANATSATGTPLAAGQSGTDLQAAPLTGAALAVSPVSVAGSAHAVSPALGTGSAQAASHATTTPAALIENQKAVRHTNPQTGHDPIIPAIPELACSLPEQYCFSAPATSHSTCA